LAHENSIACQQNEVVEYQHEVPRLSCSGRGSQVLIHEREGESVLADAHQFTGIDWDRIAGLVVDLRTWRHCNRDLCDDPLPDAVHRNPLADEVARDQVAIHTIEIRRLVAELIVACRLSSHWREPCVEAQDPSHAVRGGKIDLVARQQEGKNRLLCGVVAVDGDQVARQPQIDELGAQIGVEAAQRIQPVWDEDRVCDWHQRTNPGGKYRLKREHVVAKRGTDIVGCVPNRGLAHRERGTHGTMRQGDRCIHHHSELTAISTHILRLVGGIGGEEKACALGNQY